MSAADVTFDYVEEVSEPSYAPLIGRADGLVIRTQPLSAATVARAPRLKIVSRHGVGYDSVDLPSLNARGIALAVCGDVNSVSVAEQAMMLMLAAAKRAVRADRAVRDGAWTWRNGLEPGELWNKRLLIVGFGRAGKHLARMADGFRHGDPRLRSDPPEARLAGRQCSAGGDRGGRPRLGGLRHRACPEGRQAGDRGGGDSP